MVSTTVQSNNLQSSNRNECSSQSVMNSKQNSTIDNETIKNIKVEDGADEIKIFSASSINKNEPDDVDIEDRLSPVVEEPTSPNKNEPVNNTNIPGLYTSPFLHPYFHPYFMATTTPSMNSSVDKLSMNNPFGPTPSFPGMPFLPFYPPGMLSQPFQSSFFNPFMVPTSGVPPSIPSSRQQQSFMNNEPRRNLNEIIKEKRSQKPHIKKPLNAFMIYMKEQRAHIIEECTLKESSAINKILGQKWKELSRSEQDRYYELAKEERHRHMQLYPNWSARDNYGLRKKRQMDRLPKQNSHENNHNSQANSVNTYRSIDTDCLNLKKCRARYGLEGLSQWCKHCRRKKKCTKFLEDDLSNHKTSGNPSSVSSPGTLQSDEENSSDEPDSDDILSRQIDSIDDERDDSNEENKQEFYRSSANLPSNFLLNTRY